MLQSTKFILLFRRRIVKEEGISNIENYMFETVPELRLAATECICNMTRDEEVSKFNFC
jgi:hypothetical protein